MSDDEMNIDDGMSWFLTCCKYWLNVSTSKHASKMEHLLRLEISGRSRKRSGSVRPPLLLSPLEPSLPGHDDVAFLDSMTGSP